MAEDRRYARQVALFGIEGQRRIEGAFVSIVGLGGLGSHVLQQLAYLGVGRFALIDDDAISDSNLNRLIGAWPGDVGSLKVDIAKRHAHSILPTAEIATHAAKHDD